MLQEARSLREGAKQTQKTGGPSPKPSGVAAHAEHASKACFYRQLRHYEPAPSFPVAGKRHHPQVSAFIQVPPNPC